DAGAPIDEALSKTLVQGVGQLVLDGPGHALPVSGVLQPIRSIRREGPSPDVSNAGRQGVDVAIRPIRERNLTREPIVRDLTVPHQKTIEARDQFGMSVWGNLAVVGDLRNLP